MIFSEEITCSEISNNFENYFVIGRIYIHWESLRFFIKVRISFYCILFFQVACSAPGVCRQSDHSFCRHVCSYKPGLDRKWPCGTVNKLCLAGLCCLLLLLLLYIAQCDDFCRHTAVFYLKPANLISSPFCILFADTTRLRTCVAFKMEAYSWFLA